MMIAGSNSEGSASSQANLKMFLVMGVCRGSTITAHVWLQSNKTNGLQVSEGHGLVHHFYVVWR